MSAQLTFIGLFLTLIGACLLFFYGLPRKKIGNVVIFGGTAMKYKPDPNEDDVPASKWEPIANRFLKRAKFLNRTGFALVAVGTLLQIAPICINVIYLWKNK